jgi:flagellar protein FliS
MNSNPYSGQLEQQVLCSDPIDLVALLFDHLVLKIRSARAHLQSGDRAARAKAISSALAILSELAHSLDLERGGEMAATLQRLYGFAVERLTQGQIRESDRALEEALQTMLPLQEAWHEIRTNRPVVCPELPMSASARSREGFAVNA